MCLVKSEHTLKHVECDTDQIVYKIMHLFEPPGDAKVDIKWLISIHWHTECVHEIGETMVPVEPIDLETLDEQLNLTSGVIHCVNGPIAALSLYDEYMRTPFSKYMPIVIVECVIPKGTPCWASSNFSEIACTKVILKRIVKKDELIHGVKRYDSEK